MIAIVGFLVAYLVNHKTEDQRAASLRLHRHSCGILSLSKTHYPLLNTSLTQEDMTVL